MPTFTACVRSGKAGLITGGGCTQPLVSRGCLKSSKGMIFGQPADHKPRCQQTTASLTIDLSWGFDCRSPITTNYRHTTASKQGCCPNPERQVGALGDSNKIRRSWTWTLIESQHLRNQNYMGNSMEIMGAIDKVSVLALQTNHNIYRDGDMG